MCLAVPGEIVAIQGDDLLTRSARVSFWGVVKLVSLALAPQACVGDFVLVHAGFAIAVIDRQAAQASLDAVAALECDLAPKEGLS